MKYIFHIGRIPALSVSELEAVFNKLNINYKMRFIRATILIIETEDDINYKELLPQIGGTIKISKFLTNHQDLESAFKEIKNIISEKKGKRTIGYSIYPNQEEGSSKFAKQIKNSFVQIKKTLCVKSSIRIVFPDKNKIELNSASVLKNKLTRKGWEFNFIFLNNGIILSKTIAVQNVENYSNRDYNRPAKNSHIGMIPPKLAQIMINLARLKEGQIIFDPFCGIGTILQEALLNDYKIIGSDANKTQIKNCKINLDWLSKKYILKYPKYTIFQTDIKTMSRKVKQNSIDAIVTESTLGPVYTKTPSKTEMKNNFIQLEKIYLRFFQAAKPILRKKAKIVVTLPAYKIKQQYSFVPFIDKLEKIGYSVIRPIDKKMINKYIKLTSRNSIIYDRAKQIVAREVVIFKNK